MIESLLRQTRRKPPASENLKATSRPLIASKGNGRPRYQPKEICQRTFMVKA